MTLASETYLADDRYAFEVARLTDILRHAHDDRLARYAVECAPPDAGELYDRLHVALRAAGVDMGEAVLMDGQIKPTVRAGLVEALATMEPDAVTGEYEADQVRYVLGEIGNVWAAHIQEEAVSA